MSGNRGEQLQDEISTLEDAILYAESLGEKDLEEAKALLSKIKRFFEQGTWSMAERVLSEAASIKSYHWYREFVEKREAEKGKTSGKASEHGRFIGDGLCGKYGHNMVQIRISHRRWYYQCRLCGKRGKYQAIK